MHETHDKRQQQKLLLIAVGAVALWGAYLTLGGLRSADARRGLVVGAAFAIFLGSWLVLLAVHARRQRRKAAALQSSRDDAAAKPE